MRAVFALMAFLVVAGSGQAATGEDAAAPPAAALDDAAFDAQFACPETIPDADGRIAEFQHYQDWARDHHPDWNLRKRVDVRYGLLRRHGCAVTLAHVASSARTPFGP